MTLLVATTNHNKLREIRPLLAGLSIDLRTLADLPPLPEPEESATTYWENARLKAFAYAGAIMEGGTSVLPVTFVPPVMVVAEDSGLEISGLHGAPGVHSARFLGPDVPYPDRFAEIYRRLTDLPIGAREARFVTALAVVRGRELLFETETAIEGVVAAEPSGAHGFGYDPIFYYAPLGKTTAELTIEEKCFVSHRARAFRDFARWLRHSQLA
jgi:XTP/dITP diphosphohydrolase